MEADNKIKIFLELLFIQCRYWKEFQVIKRCFEAHKKDCGGKIRVTLLQYAQFWTQHKAGDKYMMLNKNAPSTECSMVYFPVTWSYEEKLNKYREVVSSKLKVHNDMRALVEIKIEDGVAYMEVPVHFLEKILKKKPI